jgi:hypothetical protein
VACKSAVSDAIHVLGINRYLHRPGYSMDVCHLRNNHHLHSIILGNVLADLRQAQSLLACRFTIGLEVEHN